jgi:hypothetical protein
MQALNYLPLALFVNRSCEKCIAIPCFPHAVTALLSHRCKGTLQSGLLY